MGGCCKRCRGDTRPRPRSRAAAGRAVSESQRFGCAGAHVGTRPVTGALGRAHHDPRARLRRADQHRRTDHDRRPCGAGGRPRRRAVRRREDLSRARGGVIAARGRGAAATRPVSRRDVAGAGREFRQRRSRGPDHRDRRPVRTRTQFDSWSHQCADHTRPHCGRRSDGDASNRRFDQHGQLRRADVQHERRSRRHREPRSAPAAPAPASRAWDSRSRPTWRGACSSRRSRSGRASTG